MTVMNYMLKNGDAHLKNFGILYEAGIQNRFLAPAYDVVCTNIYLPKAKPALTLQGKKIWFSKDELLIFGQKYCLLNQKEAEACYAKCVSAIETIQKDIVEYAKENRDFQDFSEKFVKILNFSLDQNSIKTYKDISDGIL